MVLLLEIPEYLYPIMFTAIAGLIVYSVYSPPVNYISAPISNFTNINKTILYTVPQPDNITKSLYKYGSVEITAKKLNMTIHEVIKRIKHSQTFFMSCEFPHEKNFGDPIILTQNCTVFGRSYVYQP